MRGVGRCSGTREVKGHGWLGTFREEGSSNFLTLRGSTGACAALQKALDNRQERERGGGRAQVQPGAIGSLEFHRQGAVVCDHGGGKRDFDKAWRGGGRSARWLGGDMPVQMDDLDAELLGHARRPAARRLRPPLAPTGAPECGPRLGGGSAASAQTAQLIDPVGVPPVRGA